MKHVGISILDFVGVGTDPENDLLKLDVNVGTANSTTAFEDAIVSGRLRVLTDDGSGVGDTNLIQIGKAIGTKTSALPTYSTATKVTAYINGLTNATVFGNKTYVVFGQDTGKTMLTGWLVRNITTTATKVTTGEVSMVTIASLGGDLAEVDLILI